MSILPAVAFALLLLLAFAVSLSLIPLIFRRKFISKLTFLDDLPRVGDFRPEVDKIQGTAVVCGGRYAEVVVSAKCEATLNVSFQQHCRSARRRSLRFALRVRRRRGTRGLAQYAGRHQVLSRTRVPHRRRWDTDPHKSEISCASVRCPAWYVPLGAFECPLLHLTSCFRIVGYQAPSLLILRKLFPDVDRQAALLGVT